MIGCIFVQMVSIHNKNIYIGIGTNIGDKLKNIEEAIHLMKVSGVSLLRIASIYESEPWGFKSQDNFYNTVLECDFKGNALELLKELKHIEKQLGRVKNNTKEYESRIIDLDILFYKDKQIKEQELTVPHPFIFQRKFVILPLMELLGNIKISALEKTFEECLKTLNDDSKILVVDKIQLIC